MKLCKNTKEWQDCSSISTKNKKAIPSPMFNNHFLITWESCRGRQEENWRSFRGRDQFGVDLGIISGLGSSFRGRDHFGVDLGIISGAVHYGKAGCKLAIRCLFFSFLFFSFVHPLRSLFDVWSVETFNVLCLSKVSFENRQQPILLRLWFYCLALLFAVTLSWSGFEIVVFL